MHHLYSRGEAIDLFIDGQSEAICQTNGVEYALNTMERLLSYLSDDQIKQMLLDDLEEVEFYF